MAALLNPFLRGLDANADAVSGAMLYIFEAGTTTPVTTYSDAAMATPQAHPLVANAAGEFEGIFVSNGTYKIRVADAADVILYENDNVRMADRPESPIFFDNEADLLADTNSYPTGTIVFTLERGRSFRAAASGATDSDVTNAGGQKFYRGGREYASVSALADSTEAARGVDEVWRGGAFTYIEAAPSAVNHDITTRGGVKLYIVRSGPAYDITQMNPAANGTTDDSAKVQHLVDKVAAEGGGEIHFPAEDYGIASTIEYKTGVALVGVGRSTSKITATSSMTNMLEPVALNESNLTGMSPVFRFGLRNLALDANSNANYCVRMVSVRDGYFSQVFTTGANAGGWSLECRNYYNHWYSCTDSGATRGWVIYEDPGADSTGSNENHWYSCRKNVGTDGWYIQAISSWINSLKLHDCVVESHSGRAVYVNASAGFAVWNLVVENLRVDSSVSGAKTIVFQGAKSDIVRPTIQNLYSQGADAPSSNNGVTDAQLIGWPFKMTYYLTIDFDAIAANSSGRHEFAMFKPGGPPGVDFTSKKWVLTLQPAGGGALSTAIAAWSVRLKNPNVGEIVLHNYGAASVNLSSQDFIVMAQRIDI